MADTSLDRLVRKEVSLGAIREKLPPRDHIGLTLAPFLDVESDDVIFDYIKDGLQEGLAPARAEDAEAELAQKDETTYDQGRASLIDWSLKDKYTASDVTRYREALLVQQATQGISSDLRFNQPFRQVEEFQRKVARHDSARRRRLDNRIEWLIMGALENGMISYNDGKIKFTVDYERPAGQQNQAPASGMWDVGTDFDPIGDVNAINDFMFDTYGFRFTRAITSRKVLDNVWKSDRFVARTGLVVGGTPSSPIDPNYLIEGWGRDAAVAVLQRATGVTFQEYDSVYRTRAVGSTTWVNNRFFSNNKVLFLPTEGDLGDVDDTDIGFAKTLTSPHPEGDWQSGFYEWEDEKRDPWVHVRGNGIKAFPVFPYMEYTYVMQAIS